VNLALAVQPSAGGLGSALSAGSAVGSGMSTNLQPVLFMGTPHTCVIKLVLCPAGIGATAAALCVYDVVSSCGHLIKDMFYSGTSGWSAQLGGVINNSTCSQGQANTNTANIVRCGLRSQHTHTLVRWMQLA
jgi:hypothetical protein